MLIREGDQRDAAIDLRLASLLAGVAGALNAAGFQATGFFSANMTGNVSAVSDHLGLGEARAAAVFGALVLAFVAGAFLSGLVIEAGRRRGVRAIYADCIAIEALLLLALGAADLLIPALVGGIGLVLALSFVMGLQNAATTRISNARVRTTHVSGMATDIGLGLAALSGRGPGREEALLRLRLYGRTILAFLVGGVAGVVLYLAVKGVLFCGLGVVLLGVALPAIRGAQAPAP